MALPLSNSFETALADETLVTAANSDDGAAGDAFDAIGGEIRFDDLRAAHGTLSGKFVVDAAEVANIDWSTAIGTVTELYTRLYIYRTAAPASQQRLIRLKNSSNVDTCFVVIHTDGKIYVFDAAGANSGMATVMPNNEWIRVEVRCLAHATTGIIHARMYQADSATILDEVSRTNVNTGADIDILAMGAATAVNVGTFWMDDLAAAGDTWIGPAGALTVAPASVVRTRAIGTAVLTREQQVAVPTADSVDGAWTDQAGGTSLFAAIDESSHSDADYIRSEVDPNNSGCRVKLGTLGDPSSSVAHEIHWRPGKDFSGGPQIDIEVRLYQGGGNVLGAGTLIADFQRTNVGQSLTTFVETLSGAEADAITNYNDLYLEFYANQV